MLKKSTIISTLITAIGGLSLLPAVGASAAGVQVNGVTYWTMQDMEDFSWEVAVAINRICGDDIACRENYITDRMNNGGEDWSKYYNLYFYQGSNFWITRISPDYNAVGFLIHDYDGWDMNHGYDVHYSTSENDLYMAWLQGERINEYYDWTWYSPSTGHTDPSYVDDFRSGSFTEGNNPIYAYGAELNGYWPFSANSEIIVTSDTSFEQDYIRTIYYSYRDRGEMQHNTVNYSDCMVNYEFGTGMECRYIFSADLMNRYALFTAEGELVETLGMNDPAVDEPIVDDPVDVSDIIGDVTDPADSGAPTVDEPVIDDPVDTAVTTPKTPDTGAQTITQTDKNTFPIWIFAPILAGISVVAFLFLPNRRRA